MTVVTPCAVVVEASDVTTVVPTPVVEAGRSIWGRLFGARSGASPSSTQPELPAQYSECVGYDQKVAWINSDRGQRILSQRPILTEYHKSGRLLKMIQSRHWDVRLNEWLYVNDGGVHQAVPLGVGIDTPAALKPRKNTDLEINHNNPPLRIMFMNHPHFLEPRVFPTSAKYEILTDGYTVFRGVISEGVVANAVTAISRMVVESEEFRKPLAERQREGRGDPFFTTGNTNDRDVLALYYCSPIYSLVEALLHNDTTRPGFIRYMSFQPRARGAQVAFRFSQAGPLFGSGARMIGGRSWHLDGMDRGTYAPFSLLIGVALSDQTSDNCGNLGVHPGSHHTLKAFLKQYSAACDHSGINPADTRQVEQRRLQALEIVRQKPLLGEPVQVKLNAGDVVIALHKLAHLGTPNFSPDIRKMVYFRVSHRNLQNLRAAALDDIWIEYEGMSEVLH